LVIVTLGDAGSVAFDGQRVHVQPPQTIVPVDTLGAGDSYIAAFLASRLAGASLEAAMAAASAAASATCLHWAAWPQPAQPITVGTLPR
jgi:fructoselysine 6-kinase